MAEPNPSTVAPWYLRNLDQALELDETTGQVHIRTSLTSGANITIPGNIVVSNVGITTFGNVPITGNTLPISGNVTVSGNVNSNVSGNVNANVSGNVGISNIGNISVAGNALPITGNVNANVSGNVVISSGNIDANVTGNVVVTQGTDPWNVTGTVGITGTANVSLASGSLDAFGRLRVSNPQTLFDTQNRYFDHNQFAKNTSGSGNVQYQASSSTYLLNVGTSGSDSAITETYKVFPYQPGKSLLVYATFCMAPNKSNQTQRVGYFTTNNGIYFENVGGTYNMVIRSYSSGAIVEDRIPQTDWNGDRLDGNGGVHNPSNKTLVPSLDQIWFCDIEWLGVGSVRVGFIIDGAYYTCHTFNHANTTNTANTDNTTTYMSTACLPVRYEIFNTSTVASASTLRQICASVISEGGYALSGIPKSIGHPLAGGVTLPNDGTFKPVLSIRLKSTTLDSIVLPTFFTVAPLAQSNFQYRVYVSAVTTGGTWTSFGSDSPVEYNLAPTSISSGIVAINDYIIASNQTAAASTQVPTGFSYQLTRNSFTGTCYEFAIEVCTSGTNQKVLSSIEWQEVN